MLLVVNMSNLDPLRILIGPRGRPRKILTDASPHNINPIVNSYELLQIKTQSFMYN